jgi:hypothetical protein
VTPDRRTLEHVNCVDGNVNLPNRKSRGGAVVVRCSYRKERVCRGEQLKFLAFLPINMYRMKIPSDAGPKKVGSRPRLRMGSGSRRQKELAEDAPDATQFRSGDPVMLPFGNCGAIFGASRQCQCFL